LEMRAFLRDDLRLPRSPRTPRPRIAGLLPTRRSSPYPPHPLPNPTPAAHSLAPCPTTRGCDSTTRLAGPLRLTDRFDALPRLKSCHPKAAIRAPGRAPPALAVSVWRRTRG